MSQKIQHALILVGAIIGGFLVGRVDISPEVQVIESSSQPEIAIIELQKILGDTLYANISGPARIVWGDTQMIESEGEQKILLSQVPDTDDLEYKSFPYVGNAKTGKFYPSDTYWARGVEVKYRRFFQSKEEAVSAGFIASKSVK